MLARLIIATLLATQALAVSTVHNTPPETDPAALPRCTSLEARSTQLEARSRYLEYNAVLSWVDSQLAASLARVPLIDGYKDYFVDQTGINGALSSNQTWSSGRYSWAKYVGTTETSLQSPVHLALNDNAASTILTNTGSMSSTNGATAANTSTKTAAGKISSCIYVNGSTDFITFPQFLAAGSGARTVCLWAKSETAINEDRPLVYLGGRSDSGNDANFELIVQGGVRFYLYKAGSDPYFEISPGTDWHHYALTYDGTNVAMYFDGNQGYNAACSINTASATNPITFGHRTPWTGCGGGQDWVGWFDDIRVYTHALSSSEISAIYNSGTGTEAASITNPATGGNMALVATQSVATVMDFLPTQGRLGLWLQTNTTAAATNDLKGYLSINNGTNWDEVLFTDSVHYSTNPYDVVWFSSITDLTGSGSNSNLLWKILTVNTKHGWRHQGRLPTGEVTYA